MLENMKSLKAYIENPKPDIELFRDTILRKRISERPPFAELLLDYEIIKCISEKYLGVKWVEPEDRESEKLYWKNTINFWYRMGYDYIRVAGGINFPAEGLTARDTAAISKGERTWQEEGKGIISSWEDFEKYEWPEVKEENLWYYEFVNANLPEGLGMLICPSSGVFEVASALCGYETLCYLLHDDASLIEAVFNKVAEAMLNLYRKLSGLSNLYGFFQGDDLGFKTGTLISPEDIRKYIVPWHKKFCELAHENGLFYILHCCGNIDKVMDDFIDEAKIDAKHSFEDEIMPVAEFKKKYGDKISVLGGVDVDKLTRFQEPELRKYVRNILRDCTPGGGYCLGSGNSIANYIPPENYLAMVDEGLSWKLDS